MSSRGGVIKRSSKRNLAGTSPEYSRFERSDLRNGGTGAGFYYSFDPTGRALKKDSDMYEALDALARKVGVIGVFSDWPATVTYYANCMGLK